MMTLSSRNRLLIGTRRYSSWSLRGWLAVRLAGLDVPDEVVALRGGGQTVEIHAISPNGLVPYLEHDGVQVWESLAICAYCAEFRPSLWPEDRMARAYARSISAEMHAGFRALRQSLPMNLGRVAPRHEIDAGTQKDIEAVDQIWCTALARFAGKGPYLFGAEMTIPDVMFAPVVTRFHSYGILLSARAQGYMEAVRAHPLMLEWAALAAAEPTSWLLDSYENLV